MTDQSERHSAPRPTQPLTRPLTKAPIRHGGDIDGVAGQYGIPAEDWIDLSTGINPHAYPLPEIPATAWQRLPGRAAEDHLTTVARAYYGLADSADICAIPGTQSVLPLLPRLLPHGQVDILSPTYGEHARCWSQHAYPNPCPNRGMPNTGTASARSINGADGAIHADHATHMLHDLREIHSLAEINTETKVAIIVNPNNPNGNRYNVIDLLELAQTLRGRGGCLILDEAFADEDPARSCAPSLPEDGLIILRSFGKFFGLAGLRLGFVLAPPEISEALRRHLGPWAVSGPAQYIGAQALADTAWQQQTRARLASARDRLRRLFVRCGIEIIGGTQLFCLIRTPDAAALYDHLCREGILCRFFEDRPGFLRFGLPGPDAHWQRLEKSLLAWNKQTGTQLTD